MRLRVIDVGTNSVRLLVAEAAQVSAGGTSGRGLRELHRALRTTRLGEGGDGCLRPAAMARTAAAIADFVTMARAFEVDRTVIAGTSAVREAVNRDAFLDLVRRVAGDELVVLSGEDEACLGYRGVVWGMNDLLPGPVLTMDIGGGSTEFAWENEDGAVDVLSLPVGAVRMTARGTTMEETARLLQPAFARFGHSAGGPARRLVGVGGTVTTLAAMAQEMTNYDPGRIHGYALSIDVAAALAARLRETPLEERCRMAGLQPERADIIPAGAMIVLAAMRGLNQNVMYVAETDILHGLALFLARDVERKSTGRDEN